MPSQQGPRRCAEGPSIRTGSLSLPEALTEPSRKRGSRHSGQVKLSEPLCCSQAVRQPAWNRWPQGSSFAACRSQTCQDQQEHGCGERRQETWRSARTCIVSRQMAHFSFWPSSLQAPASGKHLRLWVAWRYLW